jgi:hypothetical protein
MTNMAMANANLRRVGKRIHELLDEAANQSRDDPLYSAPLLHGALNVEACSNGNVLKNDMLQKNMPG